MILRKFEEKYFQSLVDFNASIFNKRDSIEESLRYRLLKNPLSENGKNETLIAFNEDDNIIGQILVVPAELNYKEKVFPAFQGMDYFVAQEVRHSLAGIIIANKYKDLQYNFGIGLNDASLAIMQAFKVNVIGYMAKYMKFSNVISILRFAFAFKPEAPKRITPPATIPVKAGRFVRVYSSEELVSMVGYWNRDTLEFSRDVKFLDWRFYYYPDKYFVYKFQPENGSINSKPEYFVVRPIIWKKVNCLLLVDYRFELEKKDAFDHILNATSKLSRKLNMAASIAGCSLPGIDNKLKKHLYFKFGRKMEIVTKFPLESKNTKTDKGSVLVTFADSDGDFFYGDDKW